MKKIIIFGSTGSIGESALQVIRRDEKNLKVIGLCANRDIKTLRAQIKEFAPKYVCVRDEMSAKRLKRELGKGIKLYSGEKGLEDFSALNSDISIMAISGISCLKPLLINIQHTKRVALANKESIVTGGSFIFQLAEKFNTEILPVDSEINALYQIIGPDKLGFASNGFCKVYLTASGGALSSYKKKDLVNVSVKKVLSHPTWKMGKRVTIDSATLVNKGFEVIETHHFFNLPFEKIGIVIHRESAVHALVECKDNTIFACLYPPDMQMPISFALYYPERFYSKDEGCFSFPNTLSSNKRKIISYSFSPIDYKKYPLLAMVLEAARRDGNSLVVLNACDEVAIDYFLRKKIKFTDIHKVMQHIDQEHSVCKIKGIEDIFFWDSWAREKTKEYLERL